MEKSLTNHKESLSSKWVALEELIEVLYKDFEHEDERIIVIKKETRKERPRNHLLCPYSNCEANKRSEDLRIQVIVAEINGVREAILKKTVRGEPARTELSFRNDYEAFIEKCPYCQRPIEVVIDETHSGRNVYLRKGRR